jgi:hypothetical protein
MEEMPPLATDEVNANDARDSGLSPDDRQHVQSCPPAHVAPAVDGCR